MSFLYSPLQSSSPIITRIGTVTFTEDNEMFSSNTNALIAGSLVFTEADESFSSNGVVLIVGAMTFTEENEAFNILSSANIIATFTFTEDDEGFSGYFVKVVNIDFDSVIQTGDWSYYGNTSMINTFTDDIANSYSYSGFDPSLDTCILKLATPANTRPFFQIDLAYKIRKLEFFSGALDFVVSFKQGNTTIQQWTHILSNTEILDVSQTINGPELASITDFSNLFIEIKASKE